MQLPDGISSEPLLFILAIMFIIFGANGVIGIYQKINDSRKNSSESNIDSKRLDFEIDKFSIDTVQKAVISLNEDLKRIRADRETDRIEIAEIKQHNIQLLLKHSAMIRYIQKLVWHEQKNGRVLPAVDTRDVPTIPEVVALTGTATAN